MTIPTLSYERPGAQPTRPPISLWERLAYIGLGVLAPIGCFIAAADKYPLAPDWQNGAWYRYIAFIPDGRAGYAFYPLLVYSMAALCAFAARPDLSRMLAVRLGLMTGIVLALQYTLIQALAMGNPNDLQFLIPLAVGLVCNLLPLAIVKLLEFILRRMSLRQGGVAVIMVTAIAITAVGAGVLAFHRDWLGIAAFTLLAFAPAWCAGVYARATMAARRLFRESGEDRPHRRNMIGAWLAWLIGFGVAWKWSITNAIALYATLPASRPGCYIATAAATGHPLLVKSSETAAADGTIYRANGQLRRVKCVEIALATICPTVHRAIRTIYDFLGPPLARFIGLHPLLADLAFLTLTPIERTTYGLLVASIPEIRAVARQLYPSIPEATRYPGKNRSSAI
jgi:hypothetical protein